ncbi:hypothetical protein OE88DRAFT_1641875 [Heliocybe sulcata]|uniref:Uncharacterized protein n=1 Tax=Heliocybe sulcata TaxID=5364 RepID=A0A5C3NJ86_9AGAM|nr:hypothetical protein OE88DRAFT_1641875 [Heliocybe sulcata]
MRVQADVKASPEKERVLKDSAGNVPGQTLLAAGPYIAACSQDLNWPRQRFHQTELCVQIDGLLDPYLVVLPEYVLMYLQQILFAADERAIANGVKPACRTAAGPAHIPSSLLVVLAEILQHLLEVEEHGGLDPALVHQHELVQRVGQKIGGRMLDGALQPLDCPCRGGYAVNLEVTAVLAAHPQGSELIKPPQNTGMATI